MNSTENFYMTLPCMGLLIVRPLSLPTQVWEMVFVKFVLNSIFYNIFDLNKSVKAVIIFSILTNGVHLAIWYVSPALCLGLICLTSSVSSCHSTIVISKGRSLLLCYSTLPLLFHCTVWHVVISHHSRLMHLFFEIKLCL